jgi:parallel beta-helix repeat protein
MKKTIAMIGAVVILSTVIALVAFPLGASATTLPNGLTAKIVATSRQKISDTIDATGYDIGIYIGPGVHDVMVTEATVTGANDEGILVQDASNIVIKNSTISNNAIDAHDGLSEDKAIVLAGTTNVLVKNNTIEDNMRGGIALVDDGPNHPLCAKHGRNYSDCQHRECHNG